MMPESAAVSVRECARLLGLSEPAIRHMVARKQIPTTRLGARVMIPMDEINALLRSNLTTK